MNRAIAWFLGFTKLGKVVEPVQRFLSGKKVYLAAAAVGVPALVTIITNFSDQGTVYLLGIVHTPEYKALMEAVAGAAMRAAVTKAANPVKDPNAVEIPAPTQLP